MSRLLDLALRQNDLAKYGEPETEGRAILCRDCAEWFAPEDREERCPGCYRLAVLRVFDLYKGVERNGPTSLQYGEAWTFEIRAYYVQAFYTSPVEPSYGYDGLVAEIESPNALDYFLADTVGA